MKIPKEYIELLPEIIIDDIKELAKDLSEAKLKKVLEQTKDEYIEALIAPGESVGIISAESIGEQGTQMTMNTKHFSGVAEMNVTVGLPRIIEILDGRVNISTPLMSIYLKNVKSAEKVKALAMQIRETLLGALVDEYKIDIAEYSIDILFSEKNVRKANLTVSDIVTSIKKSIKKISVSNNKDFSVSITIDAKDSQLSDLYKLKEKLKGVFVGGIKGIKNVLPVKRDDEYMIMTSGTNLKEVLELDFVDATRTHSNDVHEMKAVFGIEAAREVIIDQVKEVMESQGLVVDIRHIMLVADTMCSSGEVKGITRYGVVSQKSSALARASFETPIKHILMASLRNEVDELNSVVENVMLNQPIPVGTGLPGLIFDTKK